MELTEKFIFIILLGIIVFLFGWCLAEYAQRKEIEKKLALKESDMDSLGKSLKEVKNINELKIIYISYFDESTK